MHEFVHALHLSFECTSAHIGHESKLVLNRALKGYCAPLLLLLHALPMLHAVPVAHATPTR